MTDVQAASDSWPGPSRWWRPSDKEMDVDIDGHDCNFLPRKYLEEETVEGKIDGTGGHDGWYWVEVNRDEHLRMRIEIGTNESHDDDLAVVMEIIKGMATITGRVEGRNLPATGVSARVSGEGTEEEPYRIQFPDDSGKLREVTWCP